MEIVCSICIKKINGTYMRCTQCKSLRMCMDCYIVETVSHTCTGKLQIMTDSLVTLRNPSG